MPLFWEKDSDEKAKKLIFLSQLADFHAMQERCREYNVRTSGFFDTMAQVLEENLRLKRFIPLSVHQMRALEYQENVFEKETSETLKQRDLQRIRELQAQMRAIAEELETIEQRHGIR
jgi:hypothetical protein